MITSRLGMLGLIMAAMVSDAHIPSEHKYHVTLRPKRKDTPEQQKRAVDKAAKAKGLTQFYYGANSVWALNKNSADRKAQKNSWI